MKKIGDSIKPLFPEQPKKKGSERGELLDYFSKKLGRKIPFIAFKLTGFKLPDLYYLKSICDDAERRGTPWGKVFWGSIKNKDTMGQ